MKLPPKQQYDESGFAGKLGRWVRTSDALQDPITVVPMFGAILLTLVAITFNAFRDPLLIAAAIAFVASASSFYWRFSVRFTREHADGLQDLNIQEELAGKGPERKKHLETLEAPKTGFTSIGFDEGIRELDRMSNEFDQLQDAVSRWPKSSIVSIGHIPALAEATYEEGLNVLSSALELLISIDASERKCLEIDAKALESDIQALQEDETQSVRLELRVSRLAELKARLGLLSRQEIRAEEFLLRSSLIEGALNRTRIELASLRVDSSDGSVDAVSDVLQKTIDQAREVLEEMRELGF